jgi:Rha family phage regulatory protein
MKELISNMDGMTSRQIAELTGKEHRNVLRDIKTMLTDLELGALNFEQSYLNAQNKKQPEYVLDKDLTLTLTSGYSTKQRHSIAKYFNSQEPVHKVTNPKTQAMISLLVQVDRVETEQKEQELRLSSVETRLENMDGDTGYMTALAFMRSKGLKAPLKEANILGRKASAYCKSAGITMGSVPDERWGKVKSYPTEVLEDLM